MDVRIRVMRGALALLLSGQSALLIVSPASAVPGQPTDRAIEWFRHNKAPDGALPSYANGYTVGGTADGVLALAAGDENVRRFGRKSGKTPLDYLKTHAADDTSGNDPRDDAHLAGKVALAAGVAGENPRRFGGADLVAFMQDRYDSSTGGYRGGFQNFEITPFGQSLAVLGLLAAEEPVPAKAVDYLLSSQAEDGGWDSSGFGTDVQTSSMAVQALVAAANAFGEMPAYADRLSRSIEFFRTEQNDDGGFSYKKAYAGNFCSGTRPSEVDATGFAIQAIRTLGEEPASWAKAAGNPKQFLESVQNPDGSFSFQEGPDCEGNGGSTYAAILGLEETSFVCLVELGTCPRRGTARHGGGTTVDPLFEEALRANSASAPSPVPPPTTTTQATPQSESRRRPKAPLPQRKEAAAPAPAGPCGLPVCPTALVSPISAADDRMPAAPISPALKAPKRRLGTDDRLSGGSGPGRDPVVWAGLLTVLILSGSIGRELLKRKR